MVKLLGLGAVGYFAANQFAKSRRKHHAAFDDDQRYDTANAVRDAGPEAMRDKPDAHWSAVDQAADQSFPASDPPSTY
ncbi:hypothetical protein J3454_08315 [Erythrobacter sp. NFXS35]